MIRLAPLVLAAACAPEDPAGGAETAAPTACVGSTNVTWDSFGRGFVTQHCQVCHAAASPDRHGAPADVIFDTEADVLARADRILARATGADPTMPPTGGVSDDDRALLEAWLGCTE